jgi:hypothetical protein
VKESEKKEGVESHASISFHHLPVLSHPIIPTTSPFPTAYLTLTHSLTQPSSRFRNSTLSTSPTPSQESLPLPLIQKEIQLPFHSYNMKKNQNSSLRRANPNSCYRTVCRYVWCHESIRGGDLDSPLPFVKGDEERESSCLGGGYQHLLSDRIISSLLLCSKLEGGGEVETGEACNGRKEIKLTTSSSPPPS